MSNTAIRVENLSKRYRIGLEEELPDTLVGAVAQAIKRPLRNWRRLRRLTNFDDGRQTNDDTPSTVHRPSSDVRSDIGRDTLWALKDVSFQVERGEVVGIIGRNGAGKSTLLKILSQITAPTEGRAVINGRVGSLLEVGTGFHPELTGRENIYLNGAILGMTKDEIDRKFDEIVDFSGVEKFIDTPVKRYSSGMRVRLAFSVAAHLDPEILLIDEVLAVGDAAFQEKCLGKMGDVAKSGRTVLFVSHDMGAISRLCTSAFWLEEGKMAFEGSSDKAVKEYLGNLQGGTSVWTASSLQREESVSLQAVRVKDKSGHVRSNFTNQELVFVEMDVDIREWKPNLKVGFELENSKGNIIFTTFHNDVQGSSGQEGSKAGNYRFKTAIPSQLLNSGVYYVSPCAGLHRQRWIFREERLVRFDVQFQIDNCAFFAKNRPGIVGPLLEWDIISLSSINLSK